VSPKRYVENLTPVSQDVTLFGKIVIKIQLARMSRVVTTMTYKKEADTQGGKPREDRGKDNYAPRSQRRLGIPKARAGKEGSSNTGFRRNMAQPIPQS
jgi:hypothetical protein